MSFLAKLESTLEDHNNKNKQEKCVGGEISDHHLGFTSNHLLSLCFPNKSSVHTGYNVLKSIDLGLGLGAYHKFWGAYYDLVGAFLDFWGVF